MARRNKEKSRGAAIAQTIMEANQPQTREDMQEAMKDIGTIFGSMLQGEMDAHLGDENSARGRKGHSEPA